MRRADFTSPTQPHFGGPLPSKCNCAKLCKIVQKYDFQNAASLHLGIFYTQFVYLSSTLTVHIKVTSWNFEIKEKK